MAAALLCCLAITVGSCGGEPKIAENSAAVSAVPETTTSAAVTSSTPAGTTAAATTSAAVTEIATSAESSVEPEPVTSATSEYLPDVGVYSRAAALYSVDDDTILYGDNIYKRTAPASITKLITAAVAFKYLDKETVCTVGSEQSLVEEGSSICFVLPGHKLTLYDLITGMLMASGNDAAYAVAVNVARTVSGDGNMSDSEAVAYFCGLMNGFAESIGMTDSHFANPDGWDNDDHYTTVADLIILSRYILGVPEIMEITGTHKKNVIYYSGEYNTWTNSNKLLDPESSFYCESAIGLKTGTTDNAGNCLDAAFDVNGKKYITVVVGCLTADDRYELTLELISGLMMSEAA